MPIFAALFFFVAYMVFPAWEVLAYRRKFSAAKATLAGIGLLLSAGFVYLVLGDGPVAGPVAYILAFTGCLFWGTGLVIVRVRYFGMGWGAQAIERSLSKKPGSEVSSRSNQPRT